ncbi:hypothetical protein [Sphingomonas sp. LT1P40]|uniref:hypothetical protein n=1 Tax=Alteristakelama amylovorans TaxID=3096166 RepID=UPI002FCBCC1E
MSRGPDAGTQLERALICGAGVAGVAPVILSADWVRWASATFTGARHRLTLSAAPSPTLDHWLAGLPEAEFSLWGHLVADLAVASRHADADAVTFDLEALTVEDR